LDSEDEEDDGDEPESVQLLQKIERRKTGVKCPDRYAVHAKLWKGSHNSVELNKLIENAGREEIMIAIKREDKPKGIPAYNTHLSQWKSSRLTEHMINSIVGWLHMEMNRTPSCTQTVHHLLPSYTQK
jgi:hypothetical protein